MAEDSSVQVSLDELFRIEAHFQLEALTSGLEVLSQDPGSKRALDVSMRAAHSLRGAASVVGARVAKDLARAVEACFLVAQQGRLALAGRLGPLLEATELLRELSSGDAAGSLGGVGGASATSARADRLAAALLRMATTGEACAAAPGAATAAAPATPGAGAPPGAAAPAGTGAPSAGTPPAAPEPAQELSPSRKRVLVADDSRMLRELARRDLSSRGYLVEIAADGAEAWELLHNQPFDLVATDSEMPQMDGFELLTRVKQDSSLAALPMVLITGRELDAERRRQLSGAEVSVLTKGAGFQAALLQTVETMIGKAVA